MNNLDKQPKVSVIIPIYNTEKYLREALDSICCQTMKELQIILVNDGSTDGCQQIIEEYAAKDSRIEWIRQYNMGLSVARNVAISKVKGEYIYFMDSDDILDVHTFEKCYAICQERSLDLVTFDARSINEKSENTKERKYERKSLFKENVVYQGIFFLKESMQNEAFYPAAWLYFIRASFLISNFEGFQSGVIHEDNFFAFQILINAVRISYINEKFFCRRIRSASIMTTRFSMKNIEGYTYACQRIIRLQDMHKDWKPLISLYLKVTLNAVIWLGHQMTFHEKMETICRMRRLGYCKYVDVRNWLVFLFKM